MNHAGKQAYTRRMDIHNYGDETLDAKQDELTSEAQQLRETMRGLLNSGDITEKAQLTSEVGQAYRIFGDAKAAGVEVGGFTSAEDLVEKAAAPDDINKKIEQNAAKKNGEEQPVALEAGASVMMALAAQFKQDNNPGELISGGESRDGHTPDAAPMVASVNPKAREMAQAAENSLSSPFLRFEGSEQNHMPGMAAALKSIKNISIAQSPIAMRA